MLTSILRFLMVRQHEQKDVFYFLFIFFLIGCGMALGRGTAEALFFKRYGVDYLPVMYIILGVILVVITSVYASVADRFPAEKLLQKICIILSLTLLVCWVLMVFFELEFVYPVYFLVYEIASEILLVHCALYVSQNFDTLQSKRLIPIILSGAQIGTIIGGMSLAVFATFISIESLLFVWIVTLGISLMLIKRHHQRLGTSSYYRASKVQGRIVQQTLQQFRQCLHFTKSSQLMKTMSWCLFFTVVVFYVLAFSINTVYTDYFTTEAELSSFFGLLVAVNGLIALLIQLFLTNKIIDKIGVRNSNLIFPGITLVSFLFLFSSMGVLAAIVGSFVKDALMPAIRNPIRNIFFNAIPMNLRGRAHAFSIGLVLPIAMIVTGFILILIQKEFSLLTTVIFGLLMSIPLFWFSYRMNQTYGPAIINELRKKVFVPDDSMKLVISGEKKQIMKMLEKSSDSKHSEVRYAAAGSLFEFYGEKEMELILRILQTLEPAKQNILLNQIMPLLSSEKRYRVYLKFKHFDYHLEATLLIAMIAAKDKVALTYSSMSLGSSNPRIISAGIYGLLSLGSKTQEIEAWSKWDMLLNSQNSNSILAGLDVFLLYPSDQITDDILVFLQSNNFRIQKAAVNTLPNWPIDRLDDLIEIVNELTKHFEPDIRLKALSIAKLLPKKKQNKIAAICLQDNHGLVRDEAAKILFYNEVDYRIVANWLSYSNFTPYAKQAVLHLLFDLEPKYHVLQQVAYENLNEAESFFDAYKKIQCLNPAEITHKSQTKVLLILLLERCQETLDNVLITIKQYEDSESVGIIYSGLKSKDPMHIANACEALSNLNDQAISRRIIRLIEDINDTQRENTTLSSYTDKPTYKSTLDWCQKRNDNWLAFCANIE